MKRRFLSKRLTIKRETLRELNPSQLGHAMGGDGFPIPETCTSGTTDISNACCEPCCFSGESKCDATLTCHEC